MTDLEIAAMILRIDQIAKVWGCRFVLDVKKLLAFQQAQRSKASHRAHYTNGKQGIIDARAALEGK